MFSAYTFNGLIDLLSEIIREMVEYDSKLLFEQDNSKLGYFLEYLHLCMRRVTTTFIEDVICRLCGYEYIFFLDNNDFPNIVRHILENNTHSNINFVKNMQLILEFRYLSEIEKKFKESPLFDYPDAEMFSYDLVNSLSEYEIYVWNNVEDIANGVYKYSSNQECYVVLAYHRIDFLGELYNHKESKIAEEYNQLFDYEKRLWVLDTRPNINEFLVKYHRIRDLEIFILDEDLIKAFFDMFTNKPKFYECEYLNLYNLRKIANKSPAHKILCKTYYKIKALKESNYKSFKEIYIITFPTNSDSLISLGKLAPLIIIKHLVPIYKRSIKYEPFDEYFVKYYYYECLLSEIKASLTNNDNNFNIMYALDSIKSFTEPQAYYSTLEFNGKLINTLNYMMNDNNNVINIDPFRIDFQYEFIESENFENYLYISEGFDYSDIPAARKQIFDKHGNLIF